MSRLSGELPMKHFLEGFRLPQLQVSNCKNVMRLKNKVTLMMIVIMTYQK